MKKRVRFEKYREDHWKPNKKGKFDFGCPKCGWEEPEDDKRYIIKKGKCLIIKDFWKDIYEDEKLTGMGEDKNITKHIKEQIYPIFNNYVPCYDWYSGASGYQWDEVHKCPICNEEWEFDNSTI